MEGGSDETIMFYCIPVYSINNPNKAVGILSAILVGLFESPNINSIMACKIPLLYAGIITCGVAYTLQIYGQKYTLPVLASLIFSLESVFAVIGGSIILGEVMSIKEISGCIWIY